MVVLVYILIMYFLLGLFMDALAMLVITIPVVYPIILALGFDPVWFGIIAVLTVEIGLITPPMGMNIFVIKPQFWQTHLSKFPNPKRVLTICHI